MQLLEDLDIAGKRVFLRVDLDVGLSTNDTSDSLSASEQLTTNVRLQNIKPTVDFLLKQGAKQIILAGHIGRPEGPDPKLSTKHLIKPLEEILGRSVIFKDDLEFDEPESLKSLSQLLLLENLRFFEEEEKNDPAFAKQLASLADVYVNDAFAVCHREHASMVSLPELLPHAAGLHLEEEVEVLSGLLKDAESPFVAVVGGAKLETKLPVLENLSKAADNVLVGGLLARELAEERKPLGDNVIVAALTEDTKDINEISIEKFCSLITPAKTVVWNGPMGLYEEGFDKGTIDIAEAIIDSGAYSVVGGGETSDFLQSKNLLEKFSFVSSGGGAMLEFLSGKTLPGLLALE